MARQAQRLRGDVHADDLAGVGVEQQPGHVVARPAAVVEDDLVGVVTPEPAELAVERVLVEAPLQVGGRVLGVLEGNRVDGEPVPVVVDRRRGVRLALRFDRRRVAGEVEVALVVGVAEAAEGLAGRLSDGGGVHGGGSVVPRQPIHSRFRGCEPAPGCVLGRPGSAAARPPCVLAMLGSRSRNPAVDWVDGARAARFRRPKLSRCALPIAYVPGGGSTASGTRTPFGGRGSSPPRSPSPTWSGASSSTRCSASSPTCGAITTARWSSTTAAGPATT